MTEIIEFKIGEALSGTRLDCAVADATDLTRSAAAKLIEGGAVTVSGRCEVKSMP